MESDAFKSQSSLRKIKETRRRSSSRGSFGSPVEEETFELSQNQTSIKKLRDFRKTTRSTSGGSIGSPVEPESSQSQAAYLREVREKTRSTSGDSFGNTQESKSDAATPTE